MDANEKELTTWGITKGLRTGFITFLFALQMSAIITLFVLYYRSEREKNELQAKLYEKMIDYLRPTRDKMENAADTVVTAATKVIEVSQKVDSLSKNKPK
ncbi:hypothetical protein [Pedobacter ginsengisoli]|uniref:hypothetical protein n=1 Tax=Pedobacter ginsengisoli TaxID=363852 RepID=UPI00254EB8FC|nr:hypothetical protein [Pedobacter ginsengisoli]